MNNPFTLFDLPVQFQIDNALLSERYLALQKQLHPDNFAHISNKEQLAAVQKSADVNEALNILKDPIYELKLLLKFIQVSPKILKRKVCEMLSF